MKRHLQLIVIWLLAAISMQAQDIHTFPSDPAVMNGTFPDGLAYYVVSNPAYKGVADFVLVQKTGGHTVPGVPRDTIVALAQKMLTSQYRLSSPSVQEYFVKHGVMPGRKGFVQVTDNATLFRFENMVLGDNEQVLDSTLLVLMGMAEKAALRKDSVSSGWYSPSDQAIIISGDVDQEKVAAKLRMLSYMIPASESFPRGEYSWTDQDSLKVIVHEGGNEDLVTVSASWRFQRTPREYMNTVQPVIYERFMSEAGIIAENSICARLEKAGIPFADVSYGYVGSMDSLGDVCFKVMVSVAPEHADEATAVLSSVMSGLDSGNATMSELNRAGLIFMQGVKAKVREHESNASYADRCVSAFVYNSSLASRKDMADFHSSKNISDQAHLNLFNSVVSASLDSTRNLTLSCAGGNGEMSSEKLKEVFTSAWSDRGLPVSDTASAPAVSLCAPSLEKMKIRSCRREHMSGGEIWTLANGFRVIVKQMPIDKIHYSLALNRGYADVQGLQAGEGGYFSDILSLSRIGGMPSEVFMDELRQKGITMNLDVDLSTMTLKGYAPDDSLEVIVRAIHEVMYDSRIDRKKIDYFIKCETLRQEFRKCDLEDRVNAIDSRMCPDYRYTSRKNIASLTESFADHADSYMLSQSGKMNDGVLILVGDIDKKQLKTILQQYGGLFKTQKKTFTRPVIMYQPISGTVTCAVEGEQDNIDIAMSTPMALTSENYYVAAMASIALRKKLSRVVSDAGMWLRLKYDCRKYPHERFSVMISLGESSEEGFAPGTVRRDPELALKTVRDALEDPRLLNITEEDLESWKTLLKQYMEDRKNSPEYWLRAISMRYLDRKDFTTSCDVRIDAVTADKIQELLISLAKGSRVEYIINRK